MVAIHVASYDSKLHGALPIEKERTQWCQENKQNSALFNFIQWNKSREERLTDLCARNPRFLPTLPSLTKGIFHVSLMVSYRLKFLRILNFYCRTEPPSSEGSNHDRLSDLKIIDQMLRTYDRRATPTNTIGQPTRVECELFIRSFGSISEKTMVRFPSLIKYFMKKFSKAY